MIREQKLEFRDDVNRPLAYERDRPPKEFEQRRREEQDEKQPAK
jgi:hypothetical protein